MLQLDMLLLMLLLHPPTSPVPCTSSIPALEPPPYPAAFQTPNFEIQTYIYCMA